MIKLIRQYKLLCKIRTLVVTKKTGYINYRNTKKSRSLAYIDLRNKLEIISLVQIEI